MTTASEYFGGMSADYDSLIRRAVPRYDELIERLLAYLPDAACRILELGCGTGNLTVAVAERFPSAALTLVDAAPEMLAVSRSRLPATREVQLVEARFEDLELPTSSFDLVTSCISLHHVQDKGSLFGRLHALLQPGGTLLYADQMRGGTQRLHAINWQAMQRFWRQPGHLDQGEIAGLQEHADAHDFYVPILDQVRLLEAAGFGEFDVVWRNWMWGIVHARA